MMPRPKFITEKDILRWSENIDTDPAFPKALSSVPIIREVCFAGLYLAEQLEKANCPDFLITRIQYFAGRLSFGRDPWDVSQEVLEKYKNNELLFEEDPGAIKN
jgi:hypothetical protein